jgi:phosphatidylinositol alpha-1,6-mannosyltransferase
VNAAPHWLALVTDAFGGRAGIAQYNRDILSAVAGSQFASSVTVLPRSAPDAFVLPAGLEQHTARPGRLSYSLAALVTALFRPVGAVFCGHLYMAPLAVLIARLKGAKLVIQTHGIEAWDRPTPAQRAALESADLVLGVSRYTRAKVLAWAAIAPERVLVLPNTIGDTFTPGNSALRGAWRLEGKTILLTVGRLDSRERYKGHDRVISALPLLVANGHDVAYVVIGEGDDTLRLGTLARALGVSDRVRFQGGVDVKTLVDAYRAADLFVMPSTGEGFGIAFVEAMAAGTLALGLSSAGAVDALCDGELGVAVSEDDLPAAISRTLDKEKPDRNGLAVAVRARFGRQNFSTRVGLALNRLMSAA